MAIWRSPAMKALAVIYAVLANAGAALIGLFTMQVTPALKTFDQLIVAFGHFYYLKYFVTKCFWHLIVEIKKGLSR